MGIASFYGKLQSMQQEGRQISGEEGKVEQAEHERVGTRNKMKTGQGSEGGRIGDKMKKSKIHDT